MEQPGEAALPSRGISGQVLPQQSASVTPIPQKRGGGLKAFIQEQNEINAQLQEAMAAVQANFVSHNSSGNNEVKNADFDKE